MRCCVETVLASRSDPWVSLQKWNLFLNFIQLKFFFLQAELCSSRNSSGNLHPRWLWGQPMKRGTWHRHCLCDDRESISAWVAIKSSVFVTSWWFCYYLLQRCNLCFQQWKALWFWTWSGFQPSAESQDYKSCIQVPQANPLRLLSASSHSCGGRQDPVFSQSGSKSINQPLQAYTELLCTQPCWWQMVKLGRKARSSFHGCISDSVILAQHRTVSLRFQ